MQIGQARSEELVGAAGLLARASRCVAMELGRPSAVDRGSGSSLRAGSQQRIGKSCLCPHLFPLHSGIRGWGSADTLPERLGFRGCLQFFSLESRCSSVWDGRTLHLPRGSPRDRVRLRPSGRGWDLRSARDAPWIGHRSVSTSGALFSFVSQKRGASRCASTELVLPSAVDRGRGSSLRS